MTVGTLAVGDIRRRLRGPGLVLRTGPFTVRIESPLADVASSLHLLYSNHEVLDSHVGARFAMRVARRTGVRRLVRPQVHVTFDGRSPFVPLPRSMAPALVEWGLNWSIGSCAHEYLVIHAAAVERGGKVLMLPAPPGSGKTTLCTALAHRGWRLLSDEFTILDPRTGEILPAPRPVALKDASIHILASWAPGLTLGPEVVRDGVRLAYARPPQEAVTRSAERARPGWIVIPHYAPDAVPAVTPIPRGRTLLYLAENAFNHTMHGDRGFELLSAVAGIAPACRLRYPDLETAVRLVETTCRVAGDDARR